MEDLDRATMEDVFSFFRRFYVPSNASLAIVGDLDEDAALALVERYFEPIPGGTRAVRPWVPDGAARRARANRAPRSRRARSALSDLADRAPFPRRRRGAAACSATFWLAADRAASIVSW